MLELFQIIFRWKKLIGAFVLVSGILAVVITMPIIMPPYYESKMIFYTANPLSTDRANLFNKNEAGIVSPFGEEEDANRFITMAQSSYILNGMIEKYNLTKHYKIKAKSEALQEYYTKKELVSNFEILRNDEDAVEAKLLDHDAELAAKILKDIISETDQLNRTIVKENKQKVISQLDTLIHQKQLELLAINNLEEQKGFSEDLNDIKTIRSQYLVSANDNFSSIYIVEDAAVAIKKAKPVRWQILLATVIASFMFSVLLAVVFELYQQHANNINSSSK